MILKFFHGFGWSNVDDWYFRKFKQKVEKGRTKEKDGVFSKIVWIYTLKQKKENCDYILEILKNPTWNEKKLSDTCWQIQHVSYFM